MSKYSVRSQDLGESFVAALAATTATKVRESVRSWAAENKEQLFDLLLQGLDWQADLWEKRIEEKGEVDAERQYQGMLSKLDNNLYDLVLEAVLTKARDENGHNIPRHPVDPPESVTSSADQDDWDYGDDDGGRSPNDDRSDSMNPNNDAYWGSRQ